MLHFLASRAFHIIFGTIASLSLYTAYDDRPFRAIQQFTISAPDMVAARLVSEATISKLYLENHPPLLNSTSHLRGPVQPLDSCWYLPTSEQSSNTTCPLVSETRFMTEIAQTPLIRIYVPQLAKYDIIIKLRIAFCSIFAIFFYLAIARWLIIPEANQAEAESQINRFWLVLTECLIEHDIADQLEALLHLRQVILDQVVYLQPSSRLQIMRILNTQISCLESIPAANVLLDLFLIGDAENQKQRKLKATVKTLHMDLKESKSQISHLNAQAVIGDVQRDKLRRDKRDLTAENEALAGRNKILTADKEALAIKVETLNANGEALSSTNRSLETSIRDLTHKNDQQTMSIQRLETSLDSAKSERVQVQEQLEACKTQCIEARRSHDTVTAEKNAAFEQLSKVQKKNDFLKSQADVCKTREPALIEERQGHHSAIDSMQTAKREDKQRHEEEVRASKMQHKKELEDLDTEISRLRRKNNDLRILEDRDLPDLRQERSTMAGELKKLKSQSGSSKTDKGVTNEKKKLAERNQSLEASLGDFEAAKKRIVELEEQLAKAEDPLGQMQALVADQGEFWEEQNEKSRREREKAHEETTDALIARLQSAEKKREIVEAELQQARAYGRSKDEELAELKRGQHLAAQVRWNFRPAQAPASAQYPAQAMRQQPMASQPYPRPMQPLSCGPPRPCGQCSIPPFQSQPMYVHQGQPPPPGFAPGPGVQPAGLMVPNCPNGHLRLNPSVPSFPSIPALVRRSPPKQQNPLSHRQHASADVSKNPKGQVQSGARQDAETNAQPRPSVRLPRAAPQFDPREDASEARHGSSAPAPTPTTPALSSSTTGPSRRPPRIRDLKQEIHRILGAEEPRRPIPGGQSQECTRTGETQEYVGEGASQQQAGEEAQRHTGESQEPVREDQHEEIADEDVAEHAGEDDTGEQVEGQSKKKKRRRQKRKPRRAEAEGGTNKEADDDPQQDEHTEESQEPADEGESQEAVGDGEEQEQVGGQDISEHGGGGSKKRRRRKRGGRKRRVDPVEVENNGADDDQ